MTDDPRPSRHPERVLLVLARIEDDFQGRAVRFSDASEYRFTSLEELGRWLRRVTPQMQSEPGAESDLV